MLCFLNAGHVTVGAVTLDVMWDVFSKASNGKTIGLGSLRVLIVFMFAVTQRQIRQEGRKNFNLVSQENVIVNKGKLSLTNQKYGFNLQK